MRGMQREERERIARRNFPWLPPDCSEGVRLYKNLGRSKLKSPTIDQEGSFGVEVKLAHYLLVVGQFPARLIRQVELNG